MSGTVIPMKRPLAMPMPSPVMVKHDETMERLVILTNQTCLVALDKTLAALERAPSSLAAAACRVGTIAERITRAAREVRQCLPNGGL